MLKELKIANFRGFDDEVTVRFAPITILIGKNNSGKSSIIKFLLMLQQSLDASGAKMLLPEGPKINLGDFRNLKNSLTEKQILEFELTVAEISTGADLRHYYLESSKTQIDEAKLLYATHAIVPYSDSAEHKPKYDVWLLSNGKEILTYNNENADRFLYFLDQVPTQPDQREESNAQKDLVEILRRNILSLHHLPAVRSESERVIEASSPPRDNVGQKGQHTLSHLQRIIDEEREKYEFILPHIQVVAGIEKIEFENLSEFVARCYAINKKTGAKSHIAEFGFGVSQCLPIFVQGSIMASNTTLMIEQPEAQVHPTAQLELGEFFADLWKKRNVGSIIETHSDNILLRIRRLIANGKLEAKDVSIAFFDNKEGKPIITNLDIDEDGAMEPGLPIEFFGENIIEGLQLGAKK